MGWKELGELLQSARVEKGMELIDLSYETNVSIGKLEAMEKGDFSFDTSFYIKLYLRRIASVLDLNAEELCLEYESEESGGTGEEVIEIKKERGTVFYVLAVILSVLMIVVAVYIEKVLTLPYAVLENRGKQSIVVDGKPVQPGESIPIYKPVTVRNNEGRVVIRELSGRIINVDIRDFGVIIHGRGKKP